MNLRIYGAFLLSLSFPYAVVAQNSNCLPDSVTPLTQPAFRKMMFSQYRYTIAGSNSPTSGLKVETTKPSIALTGTLIPDSNKRWLVNLQLQAGVKDGFGQIFSKGKLNGYYQANLGINYFWGSGTGTYSGERCSALRLNLALMRTAAQTYYAKLDTALVLKYVFSDTAPSTFDLLGIAVNADSSGIITGYPRPNSMKGITYYRHLVSTILLKYVIISTSNRSTLEDESDSVRGNSLYPLYYRNLVNAPDSINGEQLLSDYIKTRSNLTIAPSFHTYEIDRMQDIWVRKTMYWFNVSPFINNSTTTLLDTLKHSLVDTASLTYGVQFSWNMFIKYKQSGRFLYWKIGLDLKRVDNVSDFDNIDYVKESPISGGNEVKESKTGTAYKGYLAYGDGRTLSTDLYWTFFKQPFLPGLYASSQWKYGQPWINKNKVGIEAGLVWNVSSGDKDAKNLLTIIPYVGYTNIIKEYKDVAKQTIRSLSDRFFVNVKFGIPINIGK